MHYGTKKLLVLSMVVPLAAGIACAQPVEGQDQGQPNFLGRNQNRAAEIRERIRNQNNNPDSESGNQQQFQRRQGDSQPKIVNPSNSGQGQNTPGPTGDNNQPSIRRQSGNESNNDSNRAETLRRLREQRSSSNDGPTSNNLPTGEAKSTSNDTPKEIKVNKSSGGENSGQGNRTEDALRRLREQRAVNQRATSDDSEANKTDEDTSGKAPSRLEELRNRRLQRNDDKKTADSPQTDDSKNDQPTDGDSARSRLERLREARQNQDKANNQIQDAGKETQTTEGDKKPSSREEVLERLRQRRTGDSQANESKDTSPDTKQPVTREEALERLRKRQTGESKTAEGQPETGDDKKPSSRQEALERLRNRQTGDTKKTDGQPDITDNFAKPGEKINRDRLKNVNLDNLKRGRDENKVKLEGLAGSRRKPSDIDAGKISNAREKKFDLIKNRLPESERSKFEDAFKKDGGKKGINDLLAESRGDRGTNQTRDLLRDIKGGQLIGENVDSKQLADLGIGGKRLSRDFATDRLKGLDKYKGGRDNLSGEDFDLLRSGRIPGKLQRNDFVMKNDTVIVGDNNKVININNINIENNYYGGGWHGWGGHDDWDDDDDWWDHFSVSVGGGGFGIAYNYWDGRCYYDHDYALNVFVNLGHIQVGGYDGCFVGGGYYSYGYGWLSGCIDYGGCRIWVPGFWSPYTVEECGSCQVWIPPVYEWVWTGCCWEEVQVDGGYFRTDYGDCRMVTRYYWVPGHYQKYYC